MNEKNDYAQKVIALIAQVVGIDKELVKLDSTLEDLGADSLDRLELIMKLEEVFNVDISDQDESSVKTVQQAIDLIYQLKTK